MAKAVKGAAQVQAVTIVVRNLPIGTTEHDLRALCEHVGEVVEVEIPRRTARFTKFIFGFVRFADLEAARAAVKNLSGIVVGNHRLSAQIAREHWRNANEATVPRAGAEGGVEEEDLEDEETRNMTEEEIQSAILRECRQQWQQHRRRHPDKELPSFEYILGTVSCLATSTEASLEKDLM